VPVTVLVGARDTFVDPRCSAALAGWLGVTPSIHPDAGHDLTLDAPAWVVDQIEAAHQRATARTA
jgi:pimeloyl-ACP methyl ester carboxylesterase